MKILNEENYKVSNWSGGSTTEIYISPKDSSIGNLDFDYRISTAKVGLEESNFTIMEGYKRIIMSLDNEIELTHYREDKVIKEIKLSPFKEHRFLGDDKTISKGKCQDFNFIYRDNIEGKIIPIENGKKISLESDKKYIFYIINNNTKLEASNENIIIVKNQSIVFEGIAKEILFKNSENIKNIGVYCEINDNFL